jgi:hypothetical protein
MPSKCHSQEAQDEVSCQTSLAFIYHAWSKKLSTLTGKWGWHFGMTLEKTNKNVMPAFKLKMVMGYHIGYSR